MPGAGMEASAPLGLLLPGMGHDAVAVRGWIEAGRSKQPHQGQFPARLGKCIPGQRLELPWPCQNWDKALLL